MKVAISMIIQRFSELKKRVHKVAPSSKYLILNKLIVIHEKIFQIYTIFNINKIEDIE